MKHTAKWVFCAAFGLGVASIGLLSPGPASADKPAKPKASAASVDPPLVRNSGGVQLAPPGIHWGMNPEQVAAFYDNIIEDDYKPLYRNAQAGPATNRLDAAVADDKAAFRMSKVEFGTLPTGVDSTPLRGEYSYRNGEMMMRIARRIVGSKGFTGAVAVRYFFFVRNRLWKLYDEVPLAADGPLGATFDDAKGKLEALYQVSGRLTEPDYSVNRNYAEVDWQDGTTHVRLIDRSGNKAVGIIYEERSTVNQLGSLRTYKEKNIDAVDSDIAALIRPPGSSTPLPEPSSRPPKKKK